MSVVQYQVGVMRTTSTPLLWPMIAVRCAATVPAGSSPAASCVVWRATATSPAGRPGVDRMARGGGEHAERRPERPLEIRRSVGAEGIGRPAVSHLLEEQVGRVALREVGELLDLDRVDPTLQRQQRERELGRDEPGTAPGGKHRRATACACVEHACPLLVAQRAAAVDELTARRDDVRAVLEQRDHVVEVQRAGM